MNEFLATTFSFPTVIFTVLLTVCCFYWLMVIVGALGIDALDFDFDGADGAADGAIEGVADGVAEGAAEGTAEGAAKGATEGAVHSAAEGAGFLGTVLLTLKLRNVPLTLVLSVWILMAWLLTSLAQDSAMAAMPTPGWLTGSLLAIVAVVAALPVTSLLVRPLGRMLKVEKPTSKQDIIGRVVRINTSKVDTESGWAKVDENGTELLVRVRCDADNALDRGSKALVVSYDPGRDAYEVTPIGDMLPSEAARK